MSSTPVAVASIGQLVLNNIASTPNRMSFPLPDGRIVHIAAVNLSPADAKSLLEMNTRNRTLRPAELARMAKDMANGDWEFNGDTIGFITDHDGSVVMANGQHRCNAIIKSGFTAPVILVWNLHPSATDTMDQGKNRSVKDILGMHYGRSDIKHSSDLVSISTLILNGKSASGKHTRQEIAQFAHDNFDTLGEWAAWAKSMSTQSQKIPVSSSGRVSAQSAMAPSTLGALAFHMIESGADVVRVKDFFLRIATGRISDSDNTNAITAIIRRQRGGVQLGRSGPHSTDHTVCQLTEMSVYILTYNRWVTGQLVQQVKVVKDLVSKFSELPAVVKAAVPAPVVAAVPSRTPLVPTAPPVPIAPLVPTLTP